MPQDIKQVIILRKDLNMRKGKMVAQGAHASMAAILSIANKTDTSFNIPTIDENGNQTPLGKWLNGKFKKITVYVDSEAELFEIQKKCEDIGITHALILDSGLTEFGGVPTYTCLAVGPDESTKINPITGHLKLL